MVARCHAVYGSWVLVLILTLPVIRYFATFLWLTGVFTTLPMLVAWTVDNTAGLNVRAVSPAYVVLITNLSGILAT